MLTTVFLDLKCPISLQYPQEQVAWISINFYDQLPPQGPLTQHVSLQLVL